jgi:hypothetical protein
VCPATEPVVCPAVVCPAVVCPAIPERRQGTHLCRSKEAVGPPFPRAIQGGNAWNRLRRRGPGGQEIGLGFRNLCPRAEARPTGRAVSKERLGDWDAPMEG